MFVRFDTAKRPSDMSSDPTQTSESLIWAWRAAADARRTKRTIRRMPEIVSRGRPSYSGTMSTLFTPQAIGFARTPFKETMQVPKGPGTRHEANGVLEILPEFEVGLTHIEDFSHLFVIWVFNRSDGFELLGAPPGEETPHGVFATRSPFRPNPIALTVVELLRRDGASLHVHGVDMLDGTPILDIKPYMSSIPAETLRRGWLDEQEKRHASRV